VSIFADSAADVNPSRYCSIAVPAIAVVEAMSDVISGISLNDFKCELCDDKDNMLHVHHKAYKKGAMAWEYENSNFMCLCKECHDIAHKEKNLLNEVIDSINPSKYMEAATLLHAFFNENHNDSFYSFAPFTYESGEIARAICKCNINIHDVIAIKENLLTDIRNGEDNG